MWKGAAGQRRAGGARWSCLVPSCCCCAVHTPAPLGRRPPLPAFRAVPLPAAEEEFELFERLDSEAQWFEPTTQAEVPPWMRWSPADLPRAQQLSHQHRPDVAAEMAALTGSVLHNHHHQQQQQQQHGAPPPLFQTRQQLAQQLQAQDQQQQAQQQQRSAAAAAAAQQQQQRAAAERQQQQLEEHTMMTTTIDSLGACAGGCGGRKGEGPAFGPATPVLLC